MSFTELRGFSSDRIPKSGRPIVQDLIDYAPYVRLEVFCSDEQTYEVKYTIANAAHTGTNGDGKIYVMDVQQALSIHTPISGEPAIEALEDHPRAALAQMGNGSSKPWE